MSPGWGEVPQLKPQALRIGKKVFQMKIKMLLSREWEQMMAGNVQQILLKYYMMSKFSSNANKL